MRPHVLIFILIILVQSLLLSSQPSGFTRDGSLEQITFAQNKVVGGGHGRCALAIKYRTCTIVADILERRQRRSVETLADQLRLHTYNSARTICKLVGDKADCSAARMQCSELDSDAHEEEGRCLSASRLSLGLTEEAQRSSMEGPAGRPLAVNALLLSCDKQNKGGFGDIFVVDTSGNYCRAKAAAVGCRSQRINAWLGTRGKYLAAQWLARSAARGAPAAQGAVTTDTSHISVGTVDRVQALAKENDVGNDDSGSNCTTSPSSAPERETDQEVCLDLFAACLRENLPGDALAAGNYSVSVILLGNCTMYG